MSAGKLIEHKPDMDGQEILRLYAEGFRLVCRYCKIEFVTIPEKLELGQQPISVSCPNNPNHMSLHADPTDAMKAMREILKKSKS